MVNWLGKLVYNVSEGPPCKIPAHEVLLTAREANVIFHVSVACSYRMMNGEVGGDRP